MAEYIYFLPESRNVNVPAEGDEDYLNFYFDPTVVSGDTIDFTTYGADWVSIGQVDLEHCSVQYEVYQNTGTERTATIGMIASARTPGSAEVVSVYDIATLRQDAADAGAGSISTNYTTATAKAEGSDGSVTVSYSNINTSTVGISLDNNYNGDVSIAGKYNSSGVLTGFTWSVAENAGDTVRQFTVTVSGRRSGGQDYAYAYVTIVQPCVNDVGYIIFSQSTVYTDASGYTGSVGFECPNISAITSVYTENYWVVEHGATVVYDPIEERYTGTLSFDVMSNPYNYGRRGSITVVGPSIADESLVSATLIIQQEANSAGTPQVGYIQCENPIIVIDTPDAIDNVTICQFVINYSNIVLSSVTFGDYSGNFDSYPYFPAPTKRAVCFTLNASPSTTEYTTSTIQLKGKDINGNDVDPIVLTVIQPPFIEYVEFPIWRDTELVIPSTTDYLLYKITINNNIVYSGRAYALDGSVTIRLNEIMQQVLLPNIDLTTDGLQDNNAYANALMQVSIDGGISYQKYKQIKCYADWSYKEQSSNILSRPIRKEVDRRQLLLCSAIDYAGGGPTIVVSITEAGGETRDNVFSLQNKIGTVVQSVGSADSVTVTVGNSQVTYLVTDGCKRYCLYYLNANGGFDSFIFNEASKEKDAFERLTFKRNILNTTSRHGTVEYKNKITKEWELKSGLLNDEQSQIFAGHLVGSPCAYLHDLAENIIYPVLIKTNNVDYQTFTTNGRRFCKYTINVQLAQERLRR